MSELFKTSANIQKSITVTILYFIKKHAGGETSGLWILKSECLGEIEN
jgi:hypothetical protein